jgi:hypothetical protein
MAHSKGLAVRVLPRGRRGAKLSRRQALQVKKIVGTQIEHKFKDFTVASTGIDAAGVVTGSCVAISQGTQATEREGDEIVLKSLFGRYSIIAADTTNFMRVIFFKWNIDSAVAAPTVADILQGTGTNPWIADLNQNNIEDGKFQVLFDHSHSFTLAGNACLTRRYNIYGKKLKKKRLIFNTAATTGIGQFYMMLISDSVAASHPTFMWYSRVHYTG